MSLYRSWLGFRTENGGAGTPSIAAPYGTQQARVLIPAARLRRCTCCDKPNHVAINVALDWVRCFTRDQSVRSLRFIGEADDSVAIDREVGRVSGRCKGDLLSLNTPAARARTGTIQS